MPLYKYTKQKSFRFELQSMFSVQDNGNWFAAVTEFGFAPSWSFTSAIFTTMGLLIFITRYWGKVIARKEVAFLSATAITATLTVTFNN